MLMYKAPDFYLAGAAKCGSSSLSDVLFQHPDVFVPGIKEVNYFNTDFHIEVKAEDMYFYKLLKKNTSQFFKDGTQIGAGIIEHRQEYEKLYQGCKENQISGDCSIGYFHSPVSAENIKAENSSAKIIFILRDPVDRRFSHYWMCYRMGLITKSVEDLLNDKNNLGYQEKILFETSRYQKLHNRFKKEFPDNQICIIKLDDFKKDFDQTMLRITDFLSLKEMIFEQINKNTGVYGNSKVFAFKRLLRPLILHMPHWIKTLVSPVFSFYFSKFSNTKRPEISDKSHAMLKSMYASDIDWYTSLS